MVRWLVVVVGLAVGACNGRSDRNFEDPGNAGQGNAGETTGGVSNGGSAGSTSPTGGVANGGASTGGESTGGESTGGESTGGESTGGASTGGAPNGGSGAMGGASEGGASGAGSGGAGLAGGGASGAGASGAAGASGSAGSGACTTPNPAGCPQVACESDEICWSRQGSCRPSSCACTDGAWVCTRDCGGGICRPSGCPAGCEPTSSACGTDGVTWVCYPGGTIDYDDLVEGDCHDLATQIPRFCCPPTFKPECRVE